MKTRSAVPSRKTSSAEAVESPRWLAPVAAAVLLVLSIALTAGSATASVFYLLLTRLPLLMAWWFGALGIGWIVCRLLLPRDRHVVVQGAVGAALTLWLVWVLGWAGLLNRATAWGLLIIGISVLLWRSARFLKASDGQIHLPRLPWTTALAAPPLGLLIVACCCPPSTLWAVEAFGYDVTSYHLQLPREWFALGSIAGLEHNVYSFFPSLVEVGYLHLGHLSGSVYGAIYTSQMFHASLGVLAACGIGAIVAQRSSALIGGAIGSLFLAVPWTLITASMAYNEMAVLAFGAAALWLVMQGDGSWRSAALIGLLLGASTLAKLTAGFMIALPLGLVLLAGLSNEIAPRWKPRIIALLVIALVGALTLAPYFMRNAAQTGNPVFPFAAQRLGSGHWSDFEVQRWNKGHAASEPMSQRFAALGRQWLANAGYGAIGGSPRQRQPGQIEAQNVARFDRERGVPTLWLAVFIASVVAVLHPAQRRLALAMVGLLVLQLLFWLLATHLQSRFLVFTLLPGLVLLGLGLERLDAVSRQRLSRLTPMVVACLAAVLVLCGFTILQQQTIADVPVAAIVDSLPAESRLDALKPDEAVVGDHAINHLPATSRTYLVADASRLLYIRRPFVYESAFDVSSLGAIIRDSRGDMLAVTAALRQRGITHLWIHGPELARLHATYGFDPAVSFDNMQRLIQGWRVVEQYSSIVLVEVPAASAAGESSRIR